MTIYWTKLAKLYFPEHLCMVPLLIKATSPLTVLTTQSGGLYGLICLKGSLTKRMYIFFPPYIFLALSSDKIPIFLHSYFFWTSTRVKKKKASFIVFCLCWTPGRSCISPSSMRQRSSARSWAPPSPLSSVSPRRTGGSPGWHRGGKAHVTISSRLNDWKLTWKVLEMDCTLFSS